MENLPAYDKSTGAAQQQKQPQEPAPNATIHDGPPAEAPLPPAPPLPVPQPAPYQQDARLKAMPPYKPSPTEFVVSQFGSTYIPLDSWMNQAILRLYALGYVDTAFLGIRPWTRLSVEHMLARCADKLDEQEEDDSEARGIYEALRQELEVSAETMPGKFPGHFEVESVYSRVEGIGGSPLRDGFNVGATIVNDYGRPYAAGFNNYSGFSARAEAGRFSFYFRGEYQHAPGYTGYDPAQTAALIGLDQLPAGTVTPLIPAGQISAANPFRVMETDISVHSFGHEFSFGKHDNWLGPAEGGSFAYGNNAEAIYTFKINRVEPLYIPLVWHVLGPVRYEFFVGSLKGHTYFNDPWVHVEKFSFKPSDNFEFGFERTVIWGGEGHESVNLGTFWHSFYSISDTNPNEKCVAIPPNPAPPSYDCHDPGARFSQFDYSYRLPYLRKWLTWYTDSFVHDDVTPVSAPRRTAFRTGLYLSHVPNVPKLDLRVEAASTDPTTHASNQGGFMYVETIQRDGITNKGQIFGDPIGRENKGGNAWLTYHLSPQDSIQVNYRNDKAAKDFIAGGTTQNEFGVDVRKRFDRDFEVHGWFLYERWTAPFVKPGTQSDTTTAVTLTWMPDFRKPFLSGQ